MTGGLARRFHCAAPAWKSTVWYGGLAFLRQVQARGNTLSAVCGRKGQRFDSPVGVAVECIGNRRLHRSAVVGEESAVGVEHRVGGRLFRGVVTIGPLDIRRARRARVARVVPNASEAEVRRSLEGPPCVGLGEHVRRLIPGAPDDVAEIAAGGVDNPLLDVARQIVRPESAQCSRRAHRADGLASEIGERHQTRGELHACHSQEVRQRRQALSRELRICGGLVPAHSGNRIVVLSVRVRARPARSRGPAGPWRRGTSPSPPPRSPPSHR